MTRKDAPIDPLYDFENQSIEIDVNSIVSISLFKLVKLLHFYWILLAGRAY